MKKTISQLFWFTSMAIIFAATLSPSASARSLRSYSFRGAPKDGAGPAGKLITDGEGNFYGATQQGGLTNSQICGEPPNTCGTVFEISVSHGAASERILYKFTGGADGAVPVGSLTFDSQGNLYGAVRSGGATSCNCGTIFKLTPSSDGNWTETTLFRFTGSPFGASPEGSLLFDSQGNLYGAASGGGVCNPGCEGVIFELSPNSNDVWGETVIYSFQGGADGMFPEQLAFGPDGGIYAVSNGGDAMCGCGVVFELSLENGSWIKNVLYNFTDGLDGGYPDGQLIFDSIGNLFGEATQGGSLACPIGGCGTIYELSPAGGVWNFSVVHTFNGLNGSLGQSPIGGLAIDSSGSLYGLTFVGGKFACDNGFGCGTIFKLTPATGHFSFNLLFSFDGTDGWLPSYGVGLDGAGNIYGTTPAGGTSTKCDGGCGTAFMLTP